MKNLVNKRIFKALWPHKCWHESSGMTWICRNCNTDVGWRGSNDSSVAVETLNPDLLTPEGAELVLARLTELRREAKDGNDTV